MATAQHVFSKKGGLSPLLIDTAATNPELIRGQLDHILSDPLFHNSKRFSSLLKYIVERTLEGQHQSLKERIIGIEVFERSTEYDPALDAIVRVAATEVRKRLALYYKEPAHSHEIRIELPTRSYVAEFRAPSVEPTVPSETPIEKEPTPPEQPQSTRKLSRPIYAGLILVAAALVLATWAVYRDSATPAAIDQFWAPLLNHQDPVAVIVSSQEESGRLITFRKRDITAGTAIISFLGTRNHASLLRYTQTTSLDDLRRQPLVLIGSLKNQWLIRLVNGLRYQIREDESHTSWIEDSTYPNHNWHTDLSDSDEVGREYTLITRALNSSTGQWWVGISGLRGFGSLLVQELLVDPNAIDALARQLPKDWSQKNLQIVLEFDVVNKSPGAPRIVAAYSW